MYGVGEMVGGAFAIGLITLLLSAVPVKGVKKGHRVALAAALAGSIACVIAGGFGGMSAEQLLRNYVIPSAVIFVCGFVAAARSSDDSEVDEGTQTDDDEPSLGLKMEPQPVSTEVAKEAQQQTTKPAALSYEDEHPPKTKKRHWFKSWLWSKRPDAENSAQTLVRILGNLFRLTVTAAVSMLLMGGGLLAILALDDAQKRAERDAHREAITVTTRLRGAANNSDDFCSDQRPLGVVINNGTDQALTRVEIQLLARVPGRSSNVITGFSESRISSDFIVPPRDDGGFCMVVPKTGRHEAKDLIWSAEIVGHSIVLEEMKPWMRYERD